MFWSRLLGEFSLMTWSFTCKLSLEKMYIHIWNIVSNELFYFANILSIKNKQKKNLKLFFLLFTEILSLEVLLRVKLYLKIFFKVSIFPAYSLVVKAL